MENNLQKSLKDLSALLLDKGIKMATAESCTGGWIAQQATQRAGSSDWFECGFVTYSNASKESMLGVPAATLQTHGAVSEAVALAMVQGVIAHSDAQVAVSVTGIAGPDGAVPGKPVGTVWIAWLVEKDKSRARCFQFKGDREAVRWQAVEAAISGLVEVLQENSV